MPENEKKQRWILKGNEKFALQKCLYFYSKLHRDQDISIFRFCSSYPYRGILDSLPLLQFQFCFFCFFTDNQPQIHLSVRELSSNKMDFQYALYTSQELKYYHLWCTFLLPKGPYFYWEADLNFYLILLNHQSPSPSVRKS